VDPSTPLALCVLYLALLLLLLPAIIASNFFFFRLVGATYTSKIRRTPHTRTRTRPNGAQRRRCTLHHPPRAARCWRLAGPGPPRANLLSESRMPTSDVRPPTSDSDGYGYLRSMRRRRHGMRHGARAVRSRSC
jgi:hypothetical protein